MVDDERLTCARARRVEALCGEGARVVRRGDMTMAIEHDGHLGYGHDDTDASRGRALDDLVAWATVRAMRDCADAQQEAAWLAWVARTAAGDLRADCQRKAAQVYAEARAIYAALTGAWGEDDDTKARAAAREEGA